MGEPKLNSKVGATKSELKGGAIALIPNEATESSCPLVESNYHINNEYE